jgi:hypothetical protein
MAGWREKTFDGGIVVRPRFEKDELGTDGCVGSTIEAGGFVVDVPHWPGRIVNVEVIEGALILTKKTGRTEKVHLGEATQFPAWVLIEAELGAMDRDGWRVHPEDAAFIEALTT